MQDIEQTIAECDCDYSHVCRELGACYAARVRAGRVRAEHETDCRIFVVAAGVVLCLALIVMALVEALVMRGSL